MSPRFIYATSPIDVWPGISLWKFVDELDKDDLLKPSTVMFDFAQACVIASQAGWEGDFAETPEIFWLPYPSHGDWVYGFAWKQRNNGTCFVASPLEIPHIAEYENTAVTNSWRGGPESRAAIQMKKGGA